MIILGKVDTNFESNECKRKVCGTWKNICFGEIGLKKKMSLIHTLLNWYINSQLGQPPTLLKISPKFH